MTVSASFHRALVRGVFMAAVMSALVAGRAAAQTPTVADSGETAYCLGFSFGAWNPPLNLKDAGHDPVVDTARHLRAPGGRDWALSGARAVGDSEIFLLPIWWPAGVVITLEHAPRTRADTVRGKAVALVGDGRKTPPLAAIRAWEKRCGG
jgi:hypothetical protein